MRSKQTAAAQNFALLNSMKIPARKQRLGLFPRMPSAGLRWRLHRPLGMIGTVGRDIDLPRIPEPVQQRRGILDRAGDEMGDGAFALELTVDAQQPPGDDGAAEAFVDLGPDDDIGDAGFVLEGQEDDT